MTRSSPGRHRFLRRLAPLLIPSPDSSSWGEGCRGSGGTTHKGLHLGTPIPVVPCHKTPLRVPCPAPFLGMTRMLECKAEGKGPSSPVPVPSSLYRAGCRSSCSSRCRKPTCALFLTAFSSFFHSLLTQGTSLSTKMSQRVSPLRDRGQVPCRARPLRYGDVTAPSVPSSTELGEHPAPSRDVGARGQSM